MNLALSEGNMTGFSPEIGDLRILETTPSTILFEAKVNITNPTDYSATVPYVNIQMLNNNSILGHATAQDIQVVPGPNRDILVHALWSPKNQTAISIGRELLSQYISGKPSPRPFSPFLP
jgi:hypothetical protein